MLTGALYFFESSVGAHAVRSYRIPAVPFNLDGEHMLSVRAWAATQVPIYSPQKFQAGILRKVSASRYSVGMQHRSTDYLILGAGIVGLAMARALRLREPTARIVVLEKESQLAAHASGRNSGVLHSGVYYKPGTLRATLCAEGSKLLGAYCEENGLPIRRVGKVIVPTRAEEDPQLDVLYAQGLANGAEIHLIDDAHLRQIEPEAHSASGRALHLPQVAVIDPKALVHHLGQEIQENGIEVRLNTPCWKVDVAAAIAHTPTDKIHYGMLINTAGLYADRVAQTFGVGKRYTMLPFKGLYYQLQPTASLDIRGHIYPVPDLRFPFLGVHVTKTVTGEVTLGPTAIPALGREHYGLFSGLDVAETPAILLRLAGQYLANREHFRDLTHAEGLRFFKSNFAQAAQALVPRLRTEDLLRSAKVGIRAQLLDKSKNQLEMDFVVERGPRSLHILNAISPALTCAFRFSDFVLAEYLTQESRPTLFV